MSQKTLKLLKRPPLKPGESLTSFLVRVSQSNFYESPKILADLANKPARDDRENIYCPSRAVTFEKLTALTQTRASYLYISTAHRFANLLIPHDTEAKYIKLEEKYTLPLLPDEILYKSILSERAGQFCPLCLAEDAYHRSMWLPMVVSACLKHSCLLISRCSTCGSNLSIKSIVNIQCSKCKADLRNASYIRIDSEADLMTQKAIQSWLHYKPTPPSSLDVLAEQPPRVLFRVLEGLRFTAQRLAASEWPHMYSLITWHNQLKSPYKIGTSYLTPYQSYCIYNTAFRGLTNWPTEFYHLLDALMIKPDNTIRTSGVYQAMGNLYSAWLERNWQDKAFDFIQNAFDLYLMERYNIARPMLYMDRLVRYPELADGFSYVSIHEAAELLKVTPLKIQEFVQSGQLRTAKGRIDESLFVNKADLLKLQ